MGAVLPALFLVFGLIAVIRPGWIAAVDRRQKAAGTTRRPSDVELSETYYQVIRVAGALFVLFGLVFLFPGK